MTDKKPKWQKEIESFKGIKSTFIIEGNINDIYPYYDEKDQLNYYNLDSLLIKLFKIEELTVEAVIKLEYNFVFCNPVLGFYNKKSSVPEILKDFDEANNIFKNDGNDEEKSYKVNDIEELSVIIKKALTVNKEKPIAIVMNFAARYISSPTSLDSCENNMFINLFEASMNTKAIKGYSNTLILVVEKFNDLPSWFYYNNPNVRTITIPNPDKNIRLDFIEMNYKEELESNLKIKGKFIDNTEGLKNSELKELKKLYERYKKKDENYSLLDALTMYKYGIKENMWESIDDEAVNNLENSLKDRVKGQDKAIKKVSSVIKRAVTGMSGLQHSSTGNKPKGILFFAGPTGTGKTELTKALAEVLFGDENNCIRFDMSEYSESHSDQKLFGAPPGYVGYEAGGQLTNAIKERPFSILLFDEIEKAHPSIMDKFLQILEDGRMTDGQGNTVYFSEALIIFTSNLGITKKIIDSSGKSLSKSISFPNSTKGIEKFNNFIAEFGVTTNNCIIGMEATGHYWISLFSYIVDLGFTCYVINPIQSDAFRKMYVRQTKNDSVDSFIIAQIMRFGEFSISNFSDENTFALRNLTRYNDSLEVGKITDLNVLKIQTQDKYIYDKVLLRD